MLEVEHLSFSYGMVQVLWDITLSVKENEIVTIIGPNGAGKTTLVNTIMGLLHPRNGEIRFKGENIQDDPPYKIVEKGLSLIPEGRKIFPKMTVEENVLLGAYRIKEKTTVKSLMEKCYQLFPVLEKKKGEDARALSGGEQQLLVICRGLMSNPSLLIIDEPSLGLAPILVEKVSDTIRKINDDQVTILLVEQNIRNSLEIADRGYVLEEGKILMTGNGKELLSSEHIKKVYLGI